MVKYFVGKIARTAYDIVFGAQVPNNPNKKNQDLFILDGCCGNLMGTLAGGAYLAGYALHLGMSSQIAGLLAAFPMMTNFVQLLAALVFERMARRKTLMIIMVAAYRFLVSSVIFIPLILPQPLWVPTMMVMIMAGYASMNFFQPGTNDWFISVIPERLRGRYCSRRESVFQAVSMVVSLIIGALVDRAGKGYAGFCIAYGTAIVFAVLDIIVLCKIEEPARTIDPNKRVRFRDLIRLPISNKPYLRFVMVWMIWTFSIWLANSFFSVYMIQTLNMSYTFISIQSTCQLLSLIFTIRLWGRIAEKKSWERVLRLSCLAFFCAFGLWILVRPGLSFLLIPIGLLMGFANGGMNMGAFNSRILMIPSQGRTIYLGFEAALSGVMGFLAPVLGGQLLKVYESFLAGIQNPVFNPMQLLFITATVLMTIPLLLIQLRVKITRYDEEPAI